MTDRGASPFLLAITGPSGAGKTELATSLSACLAEFDPVVVGLDNYYLEAGSFPPELQRERNFDDPRAIDIDLFKRDLSLMLRGESVTIPDYDFTRGQRRGGRPARAGRLIAIEGLFALYWKELRAMANLSVFIDLSREQCLRRRIDRDVKHRGRTRASVEDQFATTVWPMYLRYVLPTREFADLVVGGNVPASDLCLRVQRSLARRLADYWSS